MVGNRLDRDIRGANALGLFSVRMRLTDRYPATPSGVLDEPRRTVSSHAELGELLRTLG
jgi:FMN phosphatase YigB (HAD superfamily)